MKDHVCLAPIPRTGQRNDPEGSSSETANDLKTMSERDSRRQSRPSFSIDKQTRRGRRRNAKVRRWLVRGGFGLIITVAWMKRKIRTGWGPSIAIHAALIILLSLFFVHTTEATHRQIEVDVVLADEGGGNEFDGIIEDPGLNTPELPAAALAGTTQATNQVALTMEITPTAITPIVTAGAEQEFDIKELAGLGGSDPKGGSGKAGQGKGGGGKGKGNGDGEGNGNGDGNSKFFGVGARGTKFAYIVDMSGSMRENNRFQRMLVELGQSIDALTDKQSFFLAFFNHGAYPMGFPANPKIKLLAARGVNKKNIKEWYSGVYPGGGTNPHQALLMAISLKPDAIFLLTDGMFDPRVVDAVTAANAARIPVHAIGMEIPEGAALLQDLAERNNGIYMSVDGAGKMVERIVPPSIPGDPNAPPGMQAGAPGAQPGAPGMPFGQGGIPGAPAGVPGLPGAPAGVPGLPGAPAGVQGFPPGVPFGNPAGQRPALPPAGNP